MTSRSIDSFWIILGKPTTASIGNPLARDLCRYVKDNRQGFPSLEPQPSHGG